MKVLRCLTLNLWGAEAPLEARMALVEEGIRTLAPDVVALQEVCASPDLPNQADTLAGRAGLRPSSRRRSPSGAATRAWPSCPATPIAAHESRELPHATTDERRIVLSARLTVGDRDRLGAQHPPQLPPDPRPPARGPGAGHRRVVSARVAHEPQLLMGDFNARPESDEIRWLTGLTTLAASGGPLPGRLGRHHPGSPGWTWASANPYTKPLGFLQTDRRLDYIFVTPERRDGRSRILDCRMVFDRPAPGGVFASDHFGVLAEVQIVADPPPPLPATS